MKIIQGSVRVPTNLQLMSLYMQNGRKTKHITSSNAVTNELTYSSTDISVATVYEKDRVITRNKGTCYITLQTTDFSNLKKKLELRLSKLI